MLMGAYLFLGSEALIPQLTANVSAVGGAVTLIRSKSTHGVEMGRWDIFFPPRIVHVIYDIDHIVIQNHIDIK